MFRKTFWSPVGKNTSKGLSRLAYAMLNKIPARKLYDRFDRFIAKSNRRESGWIRILTFPTPTRDHGYKRKWADETSEYLFEGVSFFGPAEYDDYMTFKYGDYMVLPPEGERKTHPISRLKLIP
jgi:lipopolysaccharide cholinephosphotransferase